MTDEPRDAGPERARSQGQDEPYEDITPAMLLQVQILMEREDTDAELRPALNRFYRVTPDELYAAVSAPAVIFAKSYIETLARHAGDATWDLLGRIGFRRRQRNGETRLEVEGGAAATVVVTEDLPDEARLALLDLDVTAPELRGKELRWDKAAGKWRPSGALPAAPNEATSTD